MDATNFDRGYLRAPWTDFDVIWFDLKWPHKPPLSNGTKIVKNGPAEKKVTRQTTDNIFPKIPDATIAYNVLMPTKSDLDGPENIEIFEIGVKGVRG